MYGFYDEPVTGEVEVTEICGFAIDRGRQAAVARAEEISRAFPGKALLDPEEPDWNLRMFYVGRSDEQPLDLRLLRRVETWVRTGKGSRPDLSGLPDVKP